MKPAAPSLGSMLGYGLTIAAVWLGWEIVKAPISDRAPPALALRVAPSSPDVLRRAAESELAAGRFENAAALASDSLARAPFNARALRVKGLVAAGQGDRVAADTMLTLAGNWSLRDDPTHAWLVEQRLRQGNYRSAFAHADTLARRRPDTQASVFNLFTTAVLVDSRAMAALAELMTQDPPWRSAYLEYLEKREDADAVLLALAITLAKTPRPATNAELQNIYQSWLRENRIPAIRHLREQLARPSLSETLQDGDFQSKSNAGVVPFAWHLEAAPGLLAEVTGDDAREGNNALRVEYEGYGSGVIAYQMMMLPPGTYRLQGRERVEVGKKAATLQWTVRCLESDQSLGGWSTSEAKSGVPTWSRFAQAFSVPATGCTAQWLRLEPVPVDERARTIAWFDDLAIAPAARSGHPDR